MEIRRCDMVGLKKARLMATARRLCRSNLRNRSPHAKLLENLVEIESDIQEPYLGCLSNLNAPFNLFSARC